jgi:hypothetical protein
MSLNRGKRRRRERRRGDGLTPAPEEEPSAKPGPSQAKRRQGPKPLAERSPILPASFAVICVLGAFLTGTASRWKGTTTMIFVVLYLVLAVIEAFVAYKIYRARGGTWR